MTLGVRFVLLANLILLILAISGFVYVYYRTRASDEADREEWYEETVSLVQEVEKTVDDAESPVDCDRLQREIVPLSTRLKSHARSAPRGVDEGIVERLHELGVDCYRVGMEHTEYGAAQTGVFVEEKLEELGDVAEELEEDAASRL